MSPGPTRRTRAAIPAPVPAGLPLQDITAEDIPLLPAVPARLLQVIASGVSEAGRSEAAVLPAAGNLRGFPVYISLLISRVRPVLIITASDFVLGAVVLYIWITQGFHKIAQSSKSS